MKTLLVGAVATLAVAIAALAPSAASAGGNGKPGPHGKHFQHGPYGHFKGPGWGFKGHFGGPVVYAGYACPRIPVTVYTPYGPTVQFVRSCGGYY